MRSESASTILTITAFNAKVESYYVDGNYLHLNYSIELPSEENQNIVKRSVDFDNELNNQLDHSIPDTYELVRIKFNLLDTKVRYTEN